MHRVFADLKRYYRYVEREEQRSDLHAAEDRNVILKNANLASKVAVLKSSNNGKEAMREAKEDTIKALKLASSKVFTAEFMVHRERIASKIVAKVHVAQMIFSEHRYKRSLGNVAENFAVRALSAKRMAQAQTSMVLIAALLVHEKMRVERTVIEVHVLAPRITSSRLRLFSGGSIFASRVS